MSETTSQAYPDFSWLKRVELQKLLAALSQAPHETRIVGGAVRNSLFKEAITDIDIATTMHPEDVMQTARSLKYKAIPTGLAYGTVTIITPEGPYEVTTVREDIEPDGRHTKICFTNNWMADAQRRDFTINALYLTPQGELIDYVHGLADIHQHYIRFIGDAYQRIQEDYLRILRFFRFYAYYGQGRPNTEALLACTHFKAQLVNLSKERIWAELKKIFSAPKPSRALLWMRQSEILTTVLPESEKWGLDHFHSLIKFDENKNKTSPSFRRFLTILPPQKERLQIMANRLGFSRQERKHLLDWCHFTILPIHLLKEQKYELLPASSGLIDSLYIRLAVAISSETINPNIKDNIDQLTELLNFFTKEQPDIEFPINSHDLFNNGIQTGPYFGKIYKQLKILWMRSDYKLSRTELLEELNKIIQQKD